MDKKDEWIKRLDKIKEKNNYKTDKELSELLGVSPAFLSMVRHKKKDLGLVNKLRVLDILGYHSIKDALRLITGRKK